MIINKTDLLPVLDSDVSKIKENALSINKELIIFETSCKRKLNADGGSVRVSGDTDNTVRPEVIDKGILDFASFIKEKVRLKAEEFNGIGGGIYL
jgi:hypothetical protein